MDQELERFKKIDLRSFAASRGYVKDTRESSAGCCMMRNSNGDKIAIIQNEKTGDWVYFCVKNKMDSGTILDFLKWRGYEGHLGQVRKILREFSGAPIPEAYRFPTQRAIKKDRAAVLLAYHKAKLAGAVSYLTGRGLGPDVLALPAFADRVRVDDRGNAIFPHWDKEGLSGYEVKNRGFTGFAAGGIKGLWYSVASQDCKTLVFCESAIDALSYYVLNPPPAGGEIRLFSIGGSLNESQPELIRAAMEKAPAGSVVIAAFDDDEGGDNFAAQLRELAPPSVEVRRALPPQGMGKDWNDALKYQRGIVDRAVMPTVGSEHEKTTPFQYVAKQRFPRRKRPLTIGKEDRH